MIANKEALTHYLSKVKMTDVKKLKNREDKERERVLQSKG